ncbi:hypothetical protein F5148DRAFT_1290471 [Russula earlei]|uniref:Uncharacterized protein n=1 Tax=Russula earlei TaxID=71964 RepID=A0ACC0TVQ7_9AGAM|nr:hypothetical protein F5148DRAFT_1290471 [Russula earlei]
MKKNPLLLYVAGIAAAASLLFVACSKNGVSSSVPAGQQSISLYMADGPGFFDHVFLDVKSIEVLVDTSKNTRAHDNSNWVYIGSRVKAPDSSFVWDNLSTTAGEYDLLQLRNGIDTSLGTAMVHAGSIRLIRIDLGTNNYFVKDSIKYPLQLPPGAPSYILIRLLGNEWEQYASGHYRLWLDFDIQRSIVQLNNNAFYLIPYLKAFIVSKTGTISGALVPPAAWPEIVTIYNATDTAYALPNRDGTFKVRGLNDGTYSVFVNASNGYKDTTLSNITISNANSVSIGTVTLRK